MIKKTLAVLISLFVLTAQAQDLGELERRNGFKDIKLGMLVDSVKGAVFQKDFVELKEFEGKLYEVKDNPAYEKIGEAVVKSVELKTYKGLIYEIIVLDYFESRTYLVNNVHTKTCSRESLLNRIFYSFKQVLR